MVVKRTVGMFLSLALAFAAESAHGQRWTPAGLDSGNVWVVAASSERADPALYALTGSGSLFASSDDGATWVRRKELTEIGVASDQVGDLIVASDDSRTIYIPWRSTLVRSRDGGSSWQQLRLPLEYGRLVQGPGAVLYEVGFGLFRSDDHGAHWRDVGFAGAFVESIAFDPRRPAAALAVTQDFDRRTLTFWKSSDGARTWEATGPEIEASYGPEVLVADRARPRTWYFVDATSLRSDDDGATWSPIGGRLGALTSLASGTLLATATNPYTEVPTGVYRSTDAGRSWTPPLPATFDAPAPGPHDWVSTIAVSSQAPHTVFACGTRGIWRASAEGLGWSASSRGLSARGVNALLTTAGGVLALLSNGDLFRGRHGRWKALPHPGACSGCTLWPTAVVADQEVMVDAAAPTVLYGVQSGGYRVASRVVKSVDGGRTWRQLPFPYDDDSLCTSQHFVDIHLLATDPVQPGVLYVRGSAMTCGNVFSSFFYRTEDDATWSAVPQPPSVFGSLTIDAAGALLAAPCGPRARLQRSVDRGRTWSAIGVGLPEGADREACTELSPDPAEPRTLYAATAERGVYRSLDGGETFAPFNRGLERATVAQVLVDPRRPESPYAAVAARRVGERYLPGGVFVWDPEASRWRVLGEGLPGAHFSRTLAFDADDPSVLFAGTDDRGVFRIQR